MSIGEKLAPKNSLLSIKGICVIVGLVVAIVGAITLWSAMGGQKAPEGYNSGLLVIAAALNLVGFLCGLPILFAFTSVLFFACAPPLMATADGLRRAPTKNDDIRAGLAGIIILLIGVGITFAGVPSEGRYSTIIEVFIVIAAAVFDIIGAGLLGNIGQITVAAQLLIILCIFAVATVFASKSLMYVTMVLSTLLFCSLLPNSFVGNANKKQTGGTVIAWIGMVISMVWSIIMIAIIRGEEDCFDGESGKQEKPAETTA